MFGRNRNTNQARTGAYSDNARPRRSHEMFQHLLRALQFLSAATSLILFSIRLAKIMRLVHKASRSNGAVEGILAAAVLYTLIAMALRLGRKAGGGNLLRILLIIFDILFVAAFIVVAVLTSPKRHGSSGPCSSNASINNFVGRHASGNINCNLPWGTFILAIFSTVLHALTAAFHVAKDHRRTVRNDRAVKEEAHHDGRDGFVDGNTPGYNGDRAARV